jgi:hypothetical protein
MSRISAGCAGIADHQAMIRVSISAPEERDLDALIARFTATFPEGTEVTVARGTVFNRHGMPPSRAALLCAAPPAA